MVIIGVSYGNGLVWFPLSHNHLERELMLRTKNEINDCHIPRISIKYKKNNFATLYDNTRLLCICKETTWSTS